MSETHKRKFAERLRSEWLISFCEARADDFRPEGFSEKSLDRLESHDAYWFMRAVDSGLVSQSDGFFTSPKSAAKEQIFWSGRNGTGCRDTYLWSEPVITIGACARLVEEHNWPIDLVGTQSKYPWPFDLVCYEAGTDEERIVCEVKKATREIDKMVDQMKSYGRLKPLAAEPTCSIERNSYRKAKGIRVSWPKFLWALGPGSQGHVYEIVRQAGTALFSLVERDSTSLDYGSN